MAVVVLLRGVNVGGHRRFRPALVAAQLQHLEAINIGAAGTFVVRKRVTRAQLRREFGRRLPFETEIMICRDRDIARLISGDFFAGQPAGPGIVRFASLLARRPRATPALPMNLPSSGTWLVRVLAHAGPFVVGLHRRHMKAIGYLGKLDRILGVPVTTRSWGTIAAIGRALDK